MFTRVLLVVSLVINVGLYYGWFDVGQYQNYVDKFIAEGREAFTKDPKLQQVVETVQDKVQEIYGKDADDVKQELEGASTDEVELYVDEQFAELSDGDAKELVDYIVADSATSSVTGSVTTEE